MAVYCISDIHGHVNALRDLIGRVKFNPEKDELFLLGDYIDWGPDNMDTLSLLMFLTKRYSSVHCLMGNHEELMLRTITQFSLETADMWINVNRGDHTLAQYQQLGDNEKRQIRQWLQGLPYGAEVMVEGKRYLMAHAFPYFEDENGDERLIKHMTLWKRLKYNENPFVKMLEIYPSKRLELYDKFIFGHTLTSSYYEEQLLAEKTGNRLPEIAKRDYPLYRKALGDNIVYANDHMINIDCGAKCLGLAEDKNPEIAEEARYSSLAMLRLNDRSVFYSRLI